MRLILLSIFFILSACTSNTNSIEVKDIKTPFEQSQNTTSTYQEAISFYKKLADASPFVKLETFGNTDSGHPVHLAIISTDQDFDPVSIRKKEKQILLVNNAIHAGEPCGVDASMLLLKKYLSNKDLQSYLENTVLLFIPVYNIGGALNRNAKTRTNQNGPNSYGFRGNAKNLDLNRDFIKCDSKNAQTFNQIFAAWQPDVFIDNHTSNGADYQYTMTLIPTQHNRLDQHLAAYMNNKLLPKLYKDMKAGGWEMTPYVFVNNTPDQGIAGFLDLARYSSGYASLFNTLSFMPETHMLKPFEDRVKSTELFMDCMIKTMHEQKDLLKAARQKAIANTMSKSVFPINWTLDTSSKDSLLFKGYEAKYKSSEVSGLDRLYYDHTAPYEKYVPFYNNYKTTDSIQKPIAYIIPQAYHKVLERLRWNGVQIEQLDNDQEMEVELYRIKDFKTREAYEGHYLHYNTTVEKTKEKWQYRKGDYIIYTDQATNRYIIETLEPTAPDAFFSWNFFDGILMQKEYFSSYVFEDLAAQYLQDDPELNQALEVRKAEDPDFSQNARAQLDFIYKRTSHYEYTHRMYPVGRMMQQQ